MATTNVSVTVQQLDALQKSVGEWGTETFPDANWHSITAHLLDEVRELVDAAPSDVAEEAADCLLLLLHLAHRDGFSLVDAAMKKFAINQTRTWAPTADGRYSKHVEVEP